MAGSGWDDRRRVVRVAVLLHLLPLPGALLLLGRSALGICLETVRSGSRVCASSLEDWLSGLPIDSAALPALGWIMPLLTLILGLGLPLWGLGYWHLAHPRLRKRILFATIGVGVVINTVFFLQTFGLQLEFAVNAFYFPRNDYHPLMRQLVMTLVVWGLVNLLAVAIMVAHMLWTNWRIPPPLPEATT
jgi:hypothetical protein